jgi:hypothetical protein
MRRRKLRWVLAGLAVLLLAVGGFVLWPRPNRVARENFDRIREGMTRAEVEAILGPPGDYQTVRTAPPPQPDYTLLQPTPAEYAKEGYGREHVFVLKHSPHVEKLTWLGNEGDTNIWFISERAQYRDFGIRQKV